MGFAVRGGSKVSYPRGMFQQEQGCLWSPQNTALNMNHF